MNFTEIALALFRDGYCFELGSEQYADHEGQDAVGRSMSGALLWQQAESARLAHALQSGNANMVSAEIMLAKELAARAPDYLRAANIATAPVSVLEFGPGTAMAFREKTLPLIRSITSSRSRCILIDGSAAYLDELRRLYGESIPNLTIVRDNIFAGRRHAHYNEIVFIVMFGRTFGNLDAPASDLPPYNEAARTLDNLSKAAAGGWLAVSVGSNLQGDATKAYYEAHPEFQLNVFYRMQAELWIEGDFDPAAFGYEADMRGSDTFLQAVHTAIVTRDMEFNLEGVPFRLRKNQRLHLKNSFCFSDDFMRHSAEMAGLTPLDVIADGHGSAIHVFAKPLDF